MTVAALTPRVREALAISSSYDAETIPAGIRRSILALLRDYNFPKSLVRSSFPPLVAGQQTFALPTGTKKVLAVFFYDGTKIAYSDPLLRREVPVAPNSDMVPRRYWQTGTDITLDSPIGTGYGSLELQLLSQSMDVATNENWFTADFEDVLFYHAAFHMAAELRKTEAMQTFGALWQVKQTSLAIYLNELEFDGMEMVMREQVYHDLDRYPINSTAQVI